MYGGSRQRRSRVKSGQVGARVGSPMGELLVLPDTLLFVCVLRRQDL